MQQLIESISTTNTLLWELILMILGGYALGILLTPIISVAGVLIYGFSIVPMAHFRAWKARRTMEKSLDKKINEAENEEKA